MEDCNFSYVTHHATIKYSKGVAKIECPFKKFPSKFACDSPSDALFTYIDTLETHLDNVGRILDTTDDPKHEWYEKDGWHIFLTRYGQIRTTNRGKDLAITKIAICFKGPGILHSKEEYIWDMELAKKRALRLYIQSLEDLILEKQSESSFFSRRET